MCDQANLNKAFDVLERAARSRDNMRELALEAGPRREQHRRSYESSRHWIDAYSSAMIDLHPELKNQIMEVVRER